MPVTFPAHQGLIATAKLRWPGRIDGTALCIGAAAPDLAYPLGSWMAYHGHRPTGLLVWALPFTLLASEITRRWAAAGIFAHLPDCGPLKLRSYGVLGTRQPPRSSTLLSALLGSGSHIVLDSFAHTGRWGTDLLGFNSTAANAVQLLGSGLGSLMFLVVLVEIAGSERLAAWYGATQVETARSVVPAMDERVMFWTFVVGSTIGAFFAARLFGGSQLFLPITTLTAALLGAGAVVPALYR